MSQRPSVRVFDLRERWQRSPLRGGLLGIASVALATLAVGVLCTLVTVIVPLIY